MSLRRFFTFPSWSNNGNGHSRQQQQQEAGRLQDDDDDDDDESSTADNDDNNDKVSRVVDLDRLHPLHLREHDERSKVLQFLCLPETPTPRDDNKDHQPLQLLPLSDDAWCPARGGDNARFVGSSSRGAGVLPRRKIGIYLQALRVLQQEQDRLLAVCGSSSFPCEPGVAARLLRFEWDLHRVDHLHNHLQSQLGAGSRGQRQQKQRLQGNADCETTATATATAALMGDGDVSALVALLQESRHLYDAVVQERALFALLQLALFGAMPVEAECYRASGNSRNVAAINQYKDNIVNAGGLQAIVGAMKRFAPQPKRQQQQEQQQQAHPAAPQQSSSSSQDVIVTRIHRHAVALLVNIIFYKSSTAIHATKSLSDSSEDTQSLSSCQLEQEQEQEQKQGHDHDHHQQQQLLDMSIVRLAAEAGAYEILAAAVEENWLRVNVTVLDEVLSYERRLAVRQVPTLCRAIVRLVPLAAAEQRQQAAAAAAAEEQEAAAAVPGKHQNHRHQRRRHSRNDNNDNENEEEQQQQVVQQREDAAAAAAALAAAKNNTSYHCLFSRLALLKSAVGSLLAKDYHHGSNSSSSSAEDDTLSSFLRG